MVTPEDREKMREDINNSFNAKYPKGKKFAISFEVTDDNAGESIAKFFFGGNPKIPGISPITLHFDDVSKDEIKLKLHEFIKTL